LQHGDWTTASNAAKEVIVRNRRRAGRLLFGATLLLVSASWLVTGCGDEVTLTVPVADNRPPVVSLAGLPPQSALTGDPFELILAPYVSDDASPVAVLTFTVLSVSTGDVAGSFTGSTYQNDFTIVGDAIVTFSVEDTSGLVAIASFPVQVERGPFASNLYPPVASLELSPRYPLINLPMTFDASASYDPDGDGLDFTWQIHLEVPIGPTTTTKQTRTYGTEAARVANVTASDGGFTTTKSKRFHTWRASGLPIPEPGDPDLDFPNFEWFSRPGPGCQYSSLAVDAAGRLHIAVHDVIGGTLYYATNASGEWVSREVVEPPGALSYGMHCAIATEGSGNGLTVHIAYQRQLDATKYRLGYARRDGPAGAWAFEDVTSSSPDIGSHVSIAVEADDGTVHIAYAEADTGILWHAWGTGPFTRDPIDFAITLNSTSIALDTIAGQDDVHISYVNTAASALKYTLGTWQAGPVAYAWSITTPTAGAIEGKTSICLDGSVPHVSYYNSGVGLRHWYDDGAWVYETVDNDTNAGRFSSIALEGGSTVCIAYYYEGAGSESLRVARRRGLNSWNSGLVVDDGENMDLREIVGFWPSMQWNQARGHFDIAYCALKKANTRHVSISWNGVDDWDKVAGPEIAVGEDTGNYLDLAFDESGGGHAVWYDAKRGELVYSHNPSPAPLGADSWSNEVIDSGPNKGYGRMCSIFVDGSGVHVAWVVFDEVTAMREIRYRRKAGGAWQPRVTVTDQGASSFVGYTQVAVDGDGVVHIGYLDLITVDPFEATVRHVTGTGAAGGWSTPEYVDQTCTTATLPAMAVDADGNAHFIYADMDLSVPASPKTDGIRYATNASGGWTAHQVFNLGGAAFGPLRLGIAATEDAVHISFPSGAAGLLYAGRDLDGGTWRIEPVSVAFASGLDSEVMVGATGEPYVMYMVRPFGPVRLAWRAGEDVWIDDVVYDGPLPGDAFTAAYNPLTSTFHSAWAVWALGLGADVGVKHSYSLGFSLRTTAVTPETGLWWPDVTVDRFDGVHIVYCDTTGPGIPVLKYSVNRDGSWIAGEYAALVAGFSVTSPPRIATSPDGSAHVAYVVDDTGLWYATNRSGAWAWEPVPVGLTTPFAPCIAVDSQGYAHIGCVDANDDTLWYITNSGGAWAAPVQVADDVMDFGFAPSWFTVVNMVLDSKDKLHMVYWGNAGHIGYATNETGPWVVDVVPGVVNGFTPCIAADGNDTLHITWADGDDASAHHVTRSRGTWGTPSRAAWMQPSPEHWLAVGADGRPVISYIGVDDGGTQRTEWAVGDGAGHWTSHVIRRRGGHQASAGPGRAGQMTPAR
jgi:hypothetical protein